MDLSIGMIVKNEEKYLERCLIALLPLKDEISCEIIVTDTGSTDKTVEIAQKYADKVLHFEWCDDFSAARNTGVEASSGAWFMFIDADEIFDNSVIEIAKFIKSKDRDSYDCASYTIRNHTLENKTKYSDFKPSRIFNFTKGKRYFQEPIHEFITTTLDNIKIAALADHYGYIASVMKEKNSRNKVLLQNELKKDPKNIRIIKHIFNGLDFAGKIKLANETFDLIDASREINYEDIKYNEYTITLFLSVGHEYFSFKKYDSLIEVCERYFDNDLVKLYGENTVPNLEMHFMCGLSFFQKNDYEKSVEHIKKYQKLYIQLQRCEDKRFSSGTNKFNNPFKFSDSFRIMIDSYLKLGDLDNANKCLGESDFYKFGVDDELLLNVYIKRAIEFNRPDLFDRVLKYYQENNHGHSYSKFSSIIIGKLYFYNDISYFLDNYDVDNINKILGIAYQNMGDFANSFYHVLMQDLEVNSLKEIKIYIQIAYFYLISNVQNLSSEGINLEDKLKVEDIFNFYIETTNYYIEQIYQPVMLQKQNLDILPQEEAMCIVINSTFSDRVNDRIGYIKALKDALKYNKSFKEIILNSISIIESDSISVEDEVVVDQEYQELAMKIKQSISGLIVGEKIEEAKLVLGQYKKINPTDPDIEKFEKLMI